MPGSLANVGQSISLGAALGNVAAATRTLYVAALTATPTDATTLATMTEVTTPGSNGYTRVAVAWTTPTTADPSVSTNSAAFSIGPFTVALSSVTYIAVVSAATGTVGDLVAYIQVGPAAISTNTTLNFAANSLSISVT